MFNYNDLPPERKVLVDDNLRLIGWTMTHRMNVPISQWDDRYQDGYFGLVRAAEKYDFDHGTTFSTYATIWIRKHIQRGAEQSEGVNYRRMAQGRTGEYIEPTSIEALVEAKGDAAHLPATTGVETEAVEATFLLDVWHQVEPECDERSRAVLTEIFTSALEGRAPSKAAVARQLGCSEWDARKLFTSVEEKLRTAVAA
jgi:RNA polymerase sigma factor (sigma-70 family)